MNIKGITGKLHQFRQLLILFALCVLLTILLPGVFLTAGNFRSILYAISLQGIMICGATFPVLVGGIDRTVSGVAALGGAICCTIIAKSGFTSQSVVLGMFMGVAIGALSGVLHGIVLAHFNIPAFLLTLATSQILYGFVQTVTGNQLINVMQAKAFTQLGSARLFEIPIPVYILFVCFGISYFLLNKTVYGRQLYFVGGNREAARLSGISSKKVIIIAYMISGVMAAISGLLLSSMNQQASAMQAMGYENDVLAAIVVGGISLRGGQGSIFGAMFGALLIGILTNGMQLLGIESVYHDLIKGVIIIAAIAADMYSSYKMSGLQHGGFFKWLMRFRTTMQPGKSQLRKSV